MTNRQLFLQYVAQTSPEPLAIEMVKAEGCTLWDKDGKPYLDLIAGISVCNMGHRHPAVVEAIKAQCDQYLHLMVYGELVSSPQVQYAHLLTSHLPPQIQSVYFTNSGTEATEGAMKLAKRATGRRKMAAFYNSYHGSTQGALSLMGSEYWRNAYRPLLPGVSLLNYQSFEDLNLITEETACVVAETIQAEAGILAPSVVWMQALRRRCTQTGTLLVLDEIQAGFGRTGSLWGFEQFGIVPDILLLGKALGGGMPLGAFLASKALMDLFTFQPVLGHITTFGGHPVSCAAGLAAFKAMLEAKVVNQVKAKEALFLELLKHPAIRAVRSFGLWMALEFESVEKAQALCQLLLKKGLFTDWFLFAPHCIRIAPPLVITADEIRAACRILVEALDEI